MLARIRFSRALVLGGIVLCLHLGACTSIKIERADNVMVASALSTTVSADAQTSGTVTVNANHAPGSNFFQDIWGWIARIFLGGSKA